MNKQVFLGSLLIAGLGFVGCAGPNSSASDTVTETTTEVSDVASPIKDAFGLEPVSGANYGAGVSADAEPMSYADFMAKFEGTDSLATVVTGEVLEVCQNKGCWMTLSAPGVADAGINVRFKDYGFFMPKTLSGQQVVVEGVAKRTMTSVDDLQHYAKDAGKSADEIAAITEPKEEIEFTATGVRVL